MFTGLVEEIGQVQSVHRDPASGQLILRIRANAVIDKCQLGDSIAVDGVCLTVTAFDQKHFTVGLSRETEQRTTLASLKVASKVNCEKSLTLAQPIGGHLVQGHVDTTATIAKRAVDKDCLRITFKLDSPQQLRYVVEKGYVAIDGTSLTVTAVDDSDCSFSVMVIQYTQTRVTLPLKQLNQSVNVEFDIIGKQIVAHLERYNARMSQSTGSGHQKSSSCSCCSHCACASSASASHRSKL